MMSGLPRKVTGGVLVALALLVLAAWGPAADTAPATAPDQSAQPTASPPPYLLPTVPITAENANRVQLAGRLDAPGTNRSSLFASSFAPDGSALAALNNTLLFAWDLRTGRLLFTTERLGGTDVYFASDGSELYVVQDNGTVRVHDLSGVEQNRFSGQTGYEGVSAYASGGGWLALGGQSGGVRIWQPAERRSIVTLAPSPAPVVALAFSDDGERLAIASQDSRVTVWDWASETLLATFDHEGASISQVQFSPDGTRVLTGTLSYIALWSVPEDTLRYSLEIGEGGATGVLAVSPDGRYVVSGGRNAPLTAWQLEDGSLAGSLSEISGNRVAAAFSADGSLMATSLLDEGAQLWNLASASDQTIPGASLEMGTRRLTDVTFSPDGLRLAFFGVNGSVYLWGVVS